MDDAGEMVISRELRGYIPHLLVGGARLLVVSKEMQWARIGHGRRTTERRHHGLAGISAGLLENRHIRITAVRMPVAGCTVARKGEGT